MPLNNHQAISSEALASFQREFHSRPANQLAMNALTRGNLQEVALNRRVVNRLDMSFSHEVEPGGGVSDQKQASTCWLFADLNWLRTFAQKKMNVAAFEFSQNFAVFWDKLEKSNYFLENIIRHAGKPWDDRRVYHLMNAPNPDGGEWHMLANIIRRYGLAPKSAMPDTFNLEKSRFMNEMLAFKLREAAVRLRAMHQAGRPVEALRATKLKVMRVVYRILAIMLGEPPAKFDLAFRDKDKKFHREQGVTPREFYDKYVGVNPSDVFSLLSCPSSDMEFGRTYTAEFFGNMVGGDEWHCLNVPVSELRSRAVQVLKKEEACLFGCDVLQMSHTKEGLLDEELYDYDLVFDAPFKMDKATRVQTLQTRLTHAMVFLGVDLVDNKPVKWKVENSWGDAVGKKGVFLMSTEWFNEHVYDVVLRRQFMTPKLLRQIEQPPISLPPWHPMV